MARASMVDILQHLRDLIGDTATVQIFDDDTMQSFCDRHQSWWRLVPLNQVYSLLPGGNTQFLDFYASIGRWEKDVILQDNTYNTVTPTTSDYITGHWTFAVQPHYPILITGKLYDIYAIAADLCEAWAAKFVQKQDNQSGQFKNARGQWYEHMTRQIRFFRAQSRMSTGTLVRNDINQSDGSIW